MNEFKVGDKIRVTHISSDDEGNKDGIWDVVIQRLIDSERICTINRISGEHLYVDEAGAEDCSIRASEAILVKKGKTTKTKKWSITK